MLVTSRKITITIIVFRFFLMKKPFKRIELVKKPNNRNELTN